MRKAKIIATLGPASSSREILRELILSGMDVARLNFSHGNHQFHSEIIRHVRRLSDELETPIAIMQDLQGTKIRTRGLENDSRFELVTGQRFLVTTRNIIGSHEAVSTSYEALPRDVKPGNRVLLADGQIELRVLSISGSDIKCEIIRGGSLAQRQGINLPGVRISAPALTPKDLEDLDFGIDHEIDYIALSFVRSEHDVLALKDALKTRNADIPVIAKLERPLAIDNLDRIMEVCEGVMVARGDLGVEMPPEKVPVIQKHIITKANRKRKLVITATQMLESMISNPWPTRAEASDVANAVFDGSDALMLSGETAKGDYPVQSVQMMSKIIQESEKLDFLSPLQVDNQADSLSFPEAVCNATHHASKLINAHSIVAFTQTGSTARLISKYRPRADILASTPHSTIMNRMALYWGVRILQMREIGNVDELIVELDRTLLDRGLIQVGENIIIITGAPITEKGHTSLMKLHSVAGGAGSS